MRVNIPCRDELIAELPLFVRIEPLARPRLNFHSKRVWQPKENQKALLAETKNWTRAEPIAQAVFVDITICFERRPQDLTKKHIHPLHKSFGDVDNLTKAVLDALVQHSVLKDDIIVVGVCATKAFATEDCAIIQIWSVLDETSELDPCLSISALTS